MRLYAVRKRLDVTRNMPWQIRDYSRAPVFTTRLIITYLDSDQPSEKSSAETTSRTQEAHHIDVVAAHSLRQGQAALLLGIHRLPKPYCQQQQRQTAPKYIAAKPVMDSNGALTENPESTKYSIKDHGESMELDAPEPNAAETPDAIASSSSLDADQDQSMEIDAPESDEAATPKATADSESSSPNADQPYQPTDETIFEYSNEARTYHARYESLSEAHDMGRLNECREGCLDILTEPRLPLWTRIQVLQMLSTLFQPAGAEGCLLEAAKILDDIEKDTENEAWQTRVLRGDNDNMVSDLTVWRHRKGLLGQSLDGKRWNIDDAPDPGYFELDRRLLDRRDDEEELAPQTQAAQESTSLKPTNTKEGVAKQSTTEPQRPPSPSSEPE
jgi:hypothetical protein